MIVIASFSNREHAGDYRVGFPRGGRWLVRFNSDWQGYSREFHEPGSPGSGGKAIEAVREDRDGLAFAAALRVPAYGLLILSQDEAGPVAEDFQQEEKEAA